ncbi:MAG: putative metal-dependent hydrolase YjjV [Rhodocyclaceae bacterium]|jgi:TatD DNase family protein|nr:TatD family hydrolase [Rhodocyclaceae bacterium]MCG3185698.1 putative metal-dependent hydrolase YjjV [Rhodocyclaceae bacterium]
MTSEVRAVPLDTAACGLVDTHCHLDAAEFDLDRGAVVAAAMRGGVTAFVVPAVSVSGFALTQSMQSLYPACRYALGIHPLYVGVAVDEDLDRLDQALSDGGQIAVGEIGLDFFVPDADRARQTAFFRAQLKLARRYDLPVILHGRQALDAVLKCLREIPVAGGIAHAFNGSRQQADEFIRLGFVLGFGGAMTWTRATRIRALATSLPAHALVLETDAPDIPPEFVGRGRNMPEYLPRIAAVLAELRGVGCDEVAAVTTANACRVLPGLFSA